MIKQPDTFVSNVAPSRVGVGNERTSFDVLMTIHAFGFTGHSAWQAVSSMQRSGAMAEATPSTIASTSCGQASTHDWQPMQRSGKMIGCGYVGPRYLSIFSSLN